MEEAFAAARTPRRARWSARPTGAVVHDADEVVRRGVGMALDREVTAADGSRIPVEARSLCVHGDTPGAAALARRVRAALEEAGVRVEAFA
ncbi:5-oxoprolinase subunit A OS=Streptomyces microflavus OX=1919 GN=pxpA PE=3 SV=1 [Streptomyces microflavus]